MDRTSKKLKTSLHEKPGGIHLSRQEKRRRDGTGKKTSWLTHSPAPPPPPPTPYCLSPTDTANAINLRLLDLLRRETRHRQELEKQNTNMLQHAAHLLVRQQNLTYLASTNAMREIDINSGKTIVQQIEQANEKWAS
jgi:hypothetical protein